MKLLNSNEEGVNSATHSNLNVASNCNRSTFGRGIAYQVGACMDKHHQSEIWQRTSTSQLPLLEKVSHCKKSIKNMEAHGFALEPATAGSFYAKYDMGIFFLKLPCRRYAWACELMFEIGLE